MTFKPQHPAPADADARRAVKPVVVYPNGTLPEPDFVGRIQGINEKVRGSHRSAA